MKKFLILLASFLVGFILFFWVVDRVGWPEIKKTFLSFSGVKGLVVLILTVAIWLVEILRWQLIFKSQGNNLSFRELGEIILAGFSVTYLLAPTAVLGGEGVKAYYIKRKFSLSWTRGFSSIAIEKLLSLSVFLIFVVFGASSFLILTTAAFKKIEVISGIFIGVLTLLIAFFYFKSFKKESILECFLRLFGVKNGKNSQAIQAVEKEVFDFFHFKNRAMWQGLGMSFLRYLLTFTRCWLIVFFITGMADIFIAGGVLFFVFVSYFVPVPAALGSSEAAQAFAFSALGLGAGAGITFSFIWRGAEMLVALLGLIFLTKLGLNFFINSIMGLAGKIIPPSQQ